MVFLRRTRSFVPIAAVALALLALPAFAAEASDQLPDPDGKPADMSKPVRVDTNPVSMGGSSNGHYGGNAETYVNVGEVMGRAMVELLSGRD
jgi:hypothetical protein